MKFNICVRPPLSTEQDFEQQIINKQEGIEFADNPLCLFAADTVVDKLSSEKLVFELLVKELVDQALLEGVFPVLLVNGPNGSGKTHLIEGVLSQPTEWGQIYEIFNYLQQNEADYVKIAAFIGGYGHIYDLFNFQTEQFSAFKVARDDLSEVIVSDDAFCNLKSTEDISYFIERARQNAKQYKRESRDLMLSKAYLIKFALDDKVGEVLLMDMPLYGDCDNKIRNLLARYVINDGNVKKSKSSYENSTLRLQKSIRDGIDFQRKSMGASMSRHQTEERYKPQVSLRESRFFSLFRDFFESKGREEFVTCMSPVQTYFGLKRDAEWFCNCHRQIEENSKLYQRTTQVQQVIRENVNRSRVDARSMVSELLASGNQNGNTEYRDARFSAEQDSDPHIPLALESARTDTENLNLEELSSYAYEEAAPNAEKQPEGIASMQASGTDDLLNKITQEIGQMQSAAGAHEEHEMTRTPEALGTNYAAPDHPLQWDVAQHENASEYLFPNGNEATSQVAEQNIDVTRNELAEQGNLQLITQLSQNLASAREQSAEDEDEIRKYKDKIAELENTVFEMEKQHDQLSREVQQAFQLQSYLGANTVAGLERKSNDREIILQEQLAARDVLIDSLKAEYQELSRENNENEHQIAVLREVSVKYDALLQSTALLETEVDQLRADNKMAVESNENLMHTLGDTRARQQAQAEQYNALNAQVARYQGFESECVKLQEQTLAQQSAMYEMEAEIQELKRRIEDKETTIRELKYEMTRPNLPEEYQRVEDTVQK